MTTGNVLKNIIKFAFPCIITRIIQNLYPLIDSVIAGQLLSFENLTAVGVAGSVYSLFNDTVIGLVSGFAIVAGKKLGAQKSNDLNVVYSSSFFSTILCSLIITVVGIAFSEPMLLALRTPPEIAVHGKKYLFVLFIGFIPNAFYNFFCEMMRALGDSKSPLRILIVSSILHFLLIIPLTYSFGISGAALASVLSYLITDLWALHLMRKNFS